MVVHRFVVEPKSCATFVDAFEHDVVSAASTVGLNLEVFTHDRTADRVLRFWTIGAGSEYTSWRNGRDPSDEDGLLPGFSRCWSMLVDAEEQEVTPAWFSPLGGSQQNPREPSEENLSI